ATGVPDAKVLSLWGSSACLVRRSVDWGLPSLKKPFARRLPLLLPGPVPCLDRVEITEPTITLAPHTTAATAPCPVCTVPAARVHSRYVRHAADLPIQGRPTWLRLTVRRFFCANRDCPRVVFCEPLPGLLSRHAQATARLNEKCQHEKRHESG